uniref:Replication protein A 70 kDa DNA-binding subunit B/D first OB fold domain-containing protein n=1 Tax=Aegilops tauschii subsp. strangulata TaxID=200361 RepID=A0A453IYH9_AEGTS
SKPFQKKNLQQASFVSATRRRNPVKSTTTSVPELQAIQAKMGSAGDEFTPLSQLEYGMDKCKVRVRVSRLWESFNPKDDTLFGLDCLLIDDQGKTMQARVEPGDIERFEDLLVEGKVYALSDFHVDSQRDYYMSCSNEWTMYIRRQTVVTEIEGDIDSIPLHSFEFVKFKDLRYRCDDNSLLTDVLGHIVYVGELEEVSKKSRIIEICNARIRDLRGRALSVTLFGDVASGFTEDMLEKGQDASVVAAFAGMSVTSSSSVCSTTSSMYYLDLEIPEVQEFRANLLIQQANPVPLKTPTQKLAESWRTIEQLKSLDREEYDEGYHVFVQSLPDRCRLHQWLVLSWMRHLPKVDVQGSKEIQVCPMWPDDASSVVQAEGEGAGCYRRNEPDDLL